MNMLKSTAAIFLLVLSIANSQFVYNYEEEDDDFDTDVQDKNPSMYQYNSPAAVNQQFLQPHRSQYEEPPQTGRSRTRIRVRSRNHQLEPDYIESEPEFQTETDPRTLRQQRRQARKRQRQTENIYVQPIKPVVYSPSVFENIGLGEAPSGVYVPQDSFLNILKNPTRRHETNSPAQPTSGSLTNQFIKPAVNYAINEPGGRFFVQPPSNENTRRQNLIPVTNSQNIVQNQPQRSQDHHNNVPSVQARAVGVSRQTHERTQVEDIHGPPTVDIDSYRKYLDDVERKDISIIPKVEYANVAQRQRKPSQNRRRTITRYRESTPAREYSPSIFENVSLGEAPNGIYVPEDSLLNTLRNPSKGHQRTSQINQNRPQHVEVQPIYTQVDNENEYIPDPGKEDQYISPTPPRRKESSQRSRHSSNTRRTEHRIYRNDHEELVDTLPQSSSHRRNKQRNDNYEEFVRQPKSQQEIRPQRRQHESLRPRPQPQQQVRPQRRQQEVLRPRPQPQQQVRPQRRQQEVLRPRPQPQQQVRPQRRQQEVLRPRPQPQTISSGSDQSSRKAKLAIAELPLDTDDDGIPGEAGVNYPTLHEIPKTTFSCSEHPHNGYYADLETSCQVVHLCQFGGVQDSFLCPNGTIWNQEKFSCQWWYKVNCSDSPKFYVKNDELYKVPEKTEKKRN